MAKLSDEEKKELLRCAESSKLRDDFRNMKKIRSKRDENVCLEDYIEFLKVFQKFSGAEKKFRRIEGMEFKL